jgi:hypothetical protein
MYAVDDDDLFDRFIADFIRHECVQQVHEIEGALR